MLKALLATLLLAAATIAGAAPAVLAPSRFNDASAVDASPLGTRVPLLLVHGLGGGNEGWENFLRAYQQNESWRAMFKPYSFSYSTTVAEVAQDASAPRTISAVGAALRAQMQAYYDKPMAPPDFGFGKKRVVVLTHSMGGLVARAMMQEQVFADGQRGGDKVLHLITLATPHHGTPLADAAFKLGLQTIAEISGTWPGFIADSAWTNYDSFDMSSAACNSWLAKLNNYAPSTGAYLGKCGSVAGNWQPGFYEKIVAYGARDLQSPDTPYGFGAYKPGSSSSLVPSYAYLHDGLTRSYGNDAVVPFVSAQFDGVAIFRRGEAYSCDHRYIRRGYRQTVYSWKGSYDEWAFCSATVGNSTYTSGSASGYAASGSIFGAAGGIIDTIKTATEAERVLDWVQVAYGALLQPGSSPTSIGLGFYYRYYPATHSYVGVKDGMVYYLGPASNQQLVAVATLANFLAMARAAGY
ncbi:MAG: alpha/beta fold hydrolase [Ramlibacter sp.]|nr:alpha/beta fold hydrolase [Ramlibacter sp.]